MTEDEIPSFVAAVQKERLLWVVLGDAILVAMTVETRVREPASDLSECRQAGSSGVMFTVSRSWWQEAWQKS